MYGECVTACMVLFHSLFGKHEHKTHYRSNVGVHSRIFDNLELGKSFAGTDCHCAGAHHARTHSPSTHCAGATIAQAPMCALLHRCALLTHPLSMHPLSMHQCVPWCTGAHAWHTWLSPSLHASPWCSVCPGCPRAWTHLLCLIYMMRGSFMDQLESEMPRTNTLRCLLHSR